MILSLLNFAAMTQLACAAAQKSCSRLLNLTVGSVTRAILEASASVGLWMQFLIVQVYRGTRLSTSSGSDVDTFVQDFTLTRLSATAASGTITLSRFSSAMAALVVPYFKADGSVNVSGAQVLTADRTQSFGVIADTSHPLWSVQMGGFLVPIGTSLVTLSARALVAGTGGNVLAGSISLLGSAIPGIDLVTNTTVFSNGEDAEADAALKSRFAVYVATRSRATKGAIENAIASAQQGLTYAVIENTLPTGLPEFGFFTVTVDDGTGTPPQSLLQAVYASVDAVRPIGSIFTVQPPAVIVAVVNMTISAAAGYSKPVLQAQVADVIETYVNNLGIGAALSYTRLSALAFSVTGVENVSNVILNNGTRDIGGGPTQVVKATGASVVIN